MALQESRYHRYQLVRQPQNSRSKETLGHERAAETDISYISVVAFI